MSWAQRLKDTGLESYEANQRAEAARAAAAFRNLVRDLVDTDLPPEATRLRQVLEDAGKTPDDLRTACKQYEQRKQTLSEFAKLDTLRSRELDIPREQMGARKLFDAAQHQFETVAFQLEIESRSTSQAITAAKDAGEGLFRNLRTEIVEPIRSVLNQIALVHSQLAALMQRICDSELVVARFKLHETALQKRGGKHYSDPLLEATTKQKAITDDTTEVNRLRTKLDALLAEKERLLAEAILP